ncbi:MAG: hypothetical protein AAFP04_11620 [Myxococcota bacterium]
MRVRSSHGLWGLLFALVSNSCGPASVDSPEEEAPSLEPRIDDAGTDTDSDGETQTQLDDTSAESTAAATSLPDRIWVPVAEGSRRIGTWWSEANARRYATQAKRPFMNGGFGSDTASCGLRRQNGQDARVVKVTNLNDSGPGSLRHAVENTKGPRTVVFQVSGAIKLDREINVEEPYLTIAGQTAPWPGISLYHAGLIVRTREVCIQHVRIRVGDRKANNQRYAKNSGGEIDALSIRNSRGLSRLDNVIIDNVSLSWSSDEVFSFDRENISNVTIRDTLMGEPLNDNLHESGVHGYCALLASRAGLEWVAFVGNVMAHCIRRSPRVDEGSVVVVNNLSYNPGVYAIQLFANPGATELKTSIVGNWMSYPRDNALRWAGDVSGNRGVVKALVQHYSEDKSRSVRVHLRQNETDGDMPEILDEDSFDESPKLAVVTDAAETWHNSIYAMHVVEAKGHVLRNVGAYPAFRDEVDQRLVADIREQRGTYIDSQDDVGGYPELSTQERWLAAPTDLDGDDDGDGIINVIEWLQRYTDEVE